MTSEFRILIVEDVPTDVVLINHELRKGGLVFVSKRVDRKEDFLLELRRHTPNLVLSDSGLPSFDAFSALAIVRDQCPEIPFIFVSGSMNEGMAVEAIKSGAVDFVPKDRLSSRLVPAVQRALRLAEAQVKRKEAETEREKHVRELEAALAKFRALSATLPICIRCKTKIRDAQGSWRRLEDYVQPPVGTSVLHVVCPDCA
jgi:DNA-binding NtrC family response regulator